MSLPPLRVVIGADVSALDTALGRARRGLQGFAVAGVAAAGAVTGALVLMTRAGLASVDAQQKLARSMDATVNGLRAVQLAGSDAGVSVSEANTSLQQMTRELVRAREAGSPAAEALRRVGLSARDLEGLDADQKMALIADRVKAMGLSAGEASNILRDLGIRSRNMSLLLLQGGDAIRSAREEVRAFGLELTEAETGAIERANDAVSRMSLVFEGLRNQLAVNVAPVLERVALAFNEFATSDAAQNAIRSLATAFGDLVSVVGSDGFLTAAIVAFEGLIALSTGLASGLVFAAQNIELMTAAATLAAIALAAMGGPITLIVGAAAAAAAGLVILSRNMRDQGTAADAAQAAQVALNQSLGSEGGFASLAPGAQDQALGLAIAYEEEARKALIAAEANYELAAARQAAVFGFQVDDDGPAPGATNPSAPGIANEYAAAADNVRRWREELIAASQTVEGLRRSLMGVGGGGGGTGGGGGGGDDSEDTPTIPGVPGLASGSAVADEMAQRLEALQQGLMTEAEVLQEWYDQGMEALQYGLDSRLMTEQEYLEARTRLEEQYAQRSNQIEAMRTGNNFQIASNGIGEILGAMSQGNEKAMRASKIFNAGMAFIDTMAGASRELRKGTFGFATAAAVIAKGMGFISAIQGAGSGGGGTGGTGGGGGAAAAPAGPQYNIALDVIAGPDGRVDVDMLRGVVSDLQNQLNRGGRIVGGMA